MCCYIQWFVWLFFVIWRPFYNTTDVNHQYGIILKVIIGIDLISFINLHVLAIMHSEGLLIRSVPCYPKRGVLFDLLISLHQKPLLI